MPSVNIAPYIRNQYFDDNGVPLVGGLLYTYAAGTVNNKATYSDAEGTTANANPIVLDSAGRAHIYLESGAYDFVLKDSAENTIWTETGVSASSITTSVNTLSELMALTAGVTPIVRTLGRYSANDGGGWWYYWNSASTDADDGGMVIQPGSLPAAGRWIGLKPADRVLNTRIYGTYTDGTTDDTVRLQNCNAYCYSNGCSMLIDATVYFATNFTFTAKVKFTRSAQLRWSTFSPAFGMIVEEGDNSQHFNCTASYVPILDVNELYYGWFGETNGSHPITTAAIAAIVSTKRKVLRAVEITATGAVVCDSVTTGGVNFAYSEGSFTATLTGVTGTVTGTAYWVKIGKVVTLHVPQLLGTSNTTDMSITGLPATIQPTAITASIPIGGVQDNGTLQTTCTAVIAASTMTVIKSGDFTNSGEKGLYYPAEVTYYCQ